MGLRSKRGSPSPAVRARGALNPTREKYVVGDRATKETTWTPLGEGKKTAAKERTKAEGRYERDLLTLCSFFSRKDPQEERTARQPVKSRTMSANPRKGEFTEVGSKEESPRIPPKEP